MTKAKPEREQTLGKIASLLENSGINVDEIATVNEVSLNEWQGFYKGDDGLDHVVDMSGKKIKFVPKWIDGPAWPVVQPARPVIVRPSWMRARALRLPDGWKTAAIYPDQQVGYRRLESGDLEPFHDERAIDVANQVAVAAGVTKAVNLGDMLDASEASRFLMEVGFAQTMQPSVNYAAHMLAEQRAIVGPDGEIIVMEGNHDFRLKRSILENAAWAFGLKRADMPASWPVLSVPNLLGFDRLGVEYVEGYPAGIHYLNDNLAAIHGERAISGRSTASAIIDDERVSLMTGHVHRVEQVFKTVRTKYGPKTRFSAILGCLCRIDGAVPSTKTGVRHDLRTPERTENWQQAVGIVTYQEGDGPFSLEIIPIFDGRAIFRGQQFVARAEPEWWLRHRAAAA